MGSASSVKGFHSFPVFGGEADGRIGFPPGQAFHFSNRLSRLSGKPHVPAGEIQFHIVGDEHNRFVGWAQGKEPGGLAKKDVGLRRQAIENLVPGSSDVFRGVKRRKAPSAAAEEVDPNPERNVAIFGQPGFDDPSKGAEVAEGFETAQPVTIEGDIYPRVGEIACRLEDGAMSSGSRWIDSERA